MTYRRGYKLVQQHQGANIHMEAGFGDRESALRDAKGMAESAAKLGHDAFYRLFGPEGFIVAYSVLNGVVRERTEVTFPAEHW